MAVTYSLQGTVFRSTNFDRETFRNLATSSGTSRDEFMCSVDLTDSTPPTLPLDIATPGITAISFLVVIVQGGQITLTVKKGLNTLDFNIQGLFVLSGADITGITIKALVSGSPFVEVFGMGA